MIFSWNEISADILLSFLAYLPLWYIYRHRSAKDHLYIALIYGSFCSILFFTLFPIVNGFRNLFPSSYEVNWIPFIDVLKERPNAYLEIYLNILLFIPFSFFYIRYTDRKMGRFLLMMALTATLIELLQPVLSPLRTADITDILTNTFGALVGYALAKVSKES